MKNVYIIDSYASSKMNGIGTYIKELIMCLKETRINICLIAFNHYTQKFRFETDEKVKQMQFPAIQGFFVQHYSIIDKFLRLYIDDSSENIFIFNHTPCEFLVKTVKFYFPLSKIVFVIHDMTWTGTLVGDNKKLKKYVMAENQELFEKEFPDMFPRFNEEKRMFEAVDRIAALSLDTVELLQTAYKIPDKKISFIPNGMHDTYSCLSLKDKNQLKEKHFISSHEKLIVFAGRVTTMKGILNVINSLKKIVKIHPDFRLIVVGTIFEIKSIMQHAGEIAAKITFTGQITKNKLNEWYQIADMGVLASYSEQCNYAGIEMMMHGLPVIASDGFGVGAMFSDGINAKVARIGDRNHPEEFENNLSEAFLALLQSNKLRRRLGAGGRKIYETIYHINYMQEGYRRLFDSL